MIATDRGFLEYLPLINLGVTVMGIIGAFLVLKLSLAAFQGSLTELKDDLKELGKKHEEGMKSLAADFKEEFSQFNDKFTALDKRVVAVETVGAILGRKPPNH